MCDCRSGNVVIIVVGSAQIVVNGVCFAVIVGLMFSFVPKDRVYDRGWGGGRCL